MKQYSSTIYFVLFVLSLSAVAYFHGCDSPTDSKAVQVAAPTLVSPANEETIPATSVVQFKWNGSASKIQISCNPSFTPLLYEGDVTGTSCNVNISGFGNCSNTYTYYWHVGLISGNNTYWSDLTYHFTVSH